VNSEGESQATLLERMRPQLTRRLPMLPSFQWTSQTTVPMRSCSAVIVCDVIEAGAAAQPLIPVFGLPVKWMRFVVMGLLRVLGVGLLMTSPFDEARIGPGIWREGAHRAAKPDDAIRLSTIRNADSVHKL
jgi:hypothetical protein